MRRLDWYAIVVSGFVLVCGCGAAGPGGTEDLATPTGGADLASGDDLTVAGGDLTVAVGDLAVAGDDLTVAAGDLAVASADMTGSPGDMTGGPGDMAGSTGDMASTDMAGNCVNPGHTGPMVVSKTTRPRMEYPLVASDGTSTMYAWTMMTGSYNGRVVWSKAQGGAVVASGELGFTNSTFTDNFELFVFASKYYLYSANAYPYRLFVFNGTSWDGISSFQAAPLIKLPTQLAGFRVDTSGYTYVVFYDGATSTVPAKISNYRFAAAATDNAGGLGVITTQPGAAYNWTMRFTSYTGSVWSAETTIGTLTVPQFNNQPTISMAHAGSLWCAAYQPGYGTSPVAWIQSTGTWSSSTLTPVGGVQLAGNQGAGTFALATGDGAVSIYNGAMWDSRQIGSIGDAYHVSPFGGGYIYASRSSTTLIGAVHNGSMWTAPATLQSGLGYTPWPLSVSAGAGTFAVGYTSGGPPYQPWLVTYESGAWTTPVQLSTASSRPPGMMWQGADPTAVWGDGDLAKSRTRTGAAPGTWGTTLNLTATGSGDVTWASLARAANGHVLAAWMQWDLDQRLIFASEYDGAVWGAVIPLPGFVDNIPMVAAAGNTFVVGQPGNPSGKLARWTGSGVTSTTTLGNVRLQIASDGTSFVAAWEASGELFYVTSADGNTWSAPAKIETTGGWTLRGLTGGPAGVLVWASTSSSALTARLFTGGSWSAATTLTANNTSGCRGNVASTTALVACMNSSSFDARLFSGGSWAAKPIGTGSSNSNIDISVASDGTSYRVDYSSGSAVTSYVMQSGTWSSIINNTGVDPTPANGSIIWSSGNTCGWSLLLDYSYYGNIARSRATGTGAYFTPPASLWTGQAPPYIDRMWMTNQAGFTDAFWIAPQAGTTLPLLYVDLAF